MCVCVGQVVGVGSCQSDPCYQSVIAPETPGRGRKSWLLGCCYTRADVPEDVFSYLNTAQCAVSHGSPLVSALWRFVETGHYLISSRWVVSGAEGEVFLFHLHEEKHERKKKRNFDQLQHSIRDALVYNRVFFSGILPKFYQFSQRLAFTLQ